MTLLLGLYAAVSFVSLVVSVVTLRVVVTRSDRLREDLSRSVEEVKSHVIELRVATHHRHDDVRSLLTDIHKRQDRATYGPRGPVK